MKKKNNLFFQESEHARKERIRTNIIMAALACIGIIVIAIYSYYAYMQKSKYKEFSYVEDLEIVSVKAEEVIETDVTFNPATEITTTTQYTIIKYYFIVRYENALDGVETIQVKKSTYNKYKVGDHVKVKIYERYYDADDMYYLTTYELKIVNE